MLLPMDTGKPRAILGLMTFGTKGSLRTPLHPDESAGARITALALYNKCHDYLQSQGNNEVDTARTYMGGKQDAFL